MQIILHFTRFH